MPVTTRAAKKLKSCNESLGSPVNDSKTGLATSPTKDSGSRLSASPTRDSAVGLSTSPPRLPGADVATSPTKEQPNAGHLHDEGKSSPSSSGGAGKGDKFDDIMRHTSSTSEGINFKHGGIKDEEFYLETSPYLLEKIEDERAFPLYPEGENLLIAPDELYEDTVFMKRPALRQVLDETVDAAGLFLQDARATDAISRRPHPHIVRYFGCRVRRGRITGLAFEKLPEAFGDIVKRATADEFSKIDRDLFLRRLRSAVDHIHTLGYAHNDISLTNIMVRNSQPFLIDFGMSAALGTIPKFTGFTPGWSRLFKYQITSTVDDDLYVLGLLEERFTQDVLKRTYLTEDQAKLQAKPEDRGKASNIWIGPYLEDGKEVWKPM